MGQWHWTHLTALLRNNDKQKYAEWSIGPSRTLKGIHWSRKTKPKSNTISSAEVLMSQLMGITILHKEYFTFLSYLSHKSTSLKSSPQCHHFKAALANYEMTTIESLTIMVCYLAIKKLAIQAISPLGTEFLFGRNKAILVLNLSCLTRIGTVTSALIQILVSVICWCWMSFC